MNEKESGTWWQPELANSRSIENDGDLDIKSSKKN